MSAVPEKGVRLLSWAEDEKPLGPYDPREFTVVKEAGNGSFGTVWLAEYNSPLRPSAQYILSTTTAGPSQRKEYIGKNLVAVKRIKKVFRNGWEECLRMRELHTLQVLEPHRNVIPLFDVFMQQNELYFVFEVMEGNLYQLLKVRKGRALAPGLSASLMRQSLSAVDHLHEHGLFHRDLKPENMLITTTNVVDYVPSYKFAVAGLKAERDVVVQLKLADFGLVHELTSPPPYTEYVSTRWYRAPEVLMLARDYWLAVDLWALGAIMVEVLTLRPLLPGESELDQLKRIAQLLGIPLSSLTADLTRAGGITMPRGIENVTRENAETIPLPQHDPNGNGYEGGMQGEALERFRRLMDPLHVPHDLVDLLSGLLVFDPSKRLTTRMCLSHPYMTRIAPLLSPEAQRQHAEQGTPSVAVGNVDHTIKSPVPLHESHPYLVWYPDGYVDVVVAGRVVTHAAPTPREARAIALGRHQAIEQLLLHSQILAEKRKEAQAAPILQGAHMRIQEAQSKVAPALDGQAKGAARWAMSMPHLGGEINAHAQHAQEAQAAELQTQVVQQHMAQQVAAQQQQHIAAAVHQQQAASASPLAATAASPQVAGTPQHHSDAVYAAMSAAQQAALAVQAAPYDKGLVKNAQRTARYADRMRREELHNMAREKVRVLHHKPEQDVFHTSGMQQPVAPAVIEPDHAPPPPRAPAQFASPTAAPPMAGGAMWISTPNIMPQQQQPRPRMRPALDAQFAANFASTDRLTPVRTDMLPSSSARTDTPDSSYTHLVNHMARLGR